MGEDPKERKRMGLEPRHFGIKEVAEDRDRLAGELARLKSMAPYVEASGHYCDGMTAAWDDAQQAIGRQVDAERQLAECRARNADLALTNEVAVNRADTAEDALAQERARVEMMLDRINLALNACSMGAREEILRAAPAEPDGAADELAELIEAAEEFWRDRRQGLGPLNPDVVDRLCAAAAAYKGEGPPDPSPHP